MPVRLASSCAATGCLGAVASTPEFPGLGGIRAICGTVLMRGVRGAGANTAWESAATVMGGVG